jgi:hypothetical protein
MDSAAAELIRVAAELIRFLLNFVRKAQIFVIWS